MKDQLSDEQNEAILKALNEAIDLGPWDKSNFLGAIGKNLWEIRDHYLAQLGASTPAQIKAESHLANRIALRSGQQEIYISLYCAEGTKIASWEKIITNLPRQTISRPVYANEIDVKTLIKSKENRLNEAYVAIFINQSDILSLASEKVAKDKLGKMLLNLKDRVLNLDNISRFVHETGVYQFEKGRLIKNN